MTYSPTAADEGMVITLLIAPVRVVIDPLLVVGVELPNLNSIGELKSKFAPVIVISEPAAPEVAERVSVGLAVTVKVDVTVAVPTVTEIVCVVAVALDGIVMVLEKLPLTVVLMSPPVGVLVSESNLKIMG